ncbi:MAG TPA: YtxH domain-containing protein [Polyangiaceae bacterium]|nr:YtxH domain-containing protein [Polyangiaceae bacterium]
MKLLLRSALAVGTIVGVRRALNAFREVDMDDALGYVGLARRESTMARALPALGMAVVGAAVGAGAALLFAPQSGGELRTRLSEGVGQAKHRIGSMKERGLSSTTHSS